MRTRDGLSLEALAKMPPQATRAVLLCHPHPLYGGTMHNAVLLAVTKMLHTGDDAVATLRFNFRGVEGSGGRYAGGEGECLDAEAALDAVVHALPAAQLSVLGYSFGSWVAMQLAWRQRSVQRVAIVAPAVRLFDYEAQAMRPVAAEVLVGDRDSFVSVAQARDLAKRLGAQLHVLDGADHFFVGQRRLVARTLCPFLSPDQGLS